MVNPWRKAAESIRVLLGPLGQGQRQRPRVMDSSRSMVFFFLLELKIRFFTEASVTRSVIRFLSLPRKHDGSRFVCFSRPEISYVSRTNGARVCQLSISHYLFRCLEMSYFLRVQKAIGFVRKTTYEKKNVYMYIYIYILRNHERNFVGFF